MTLHQPCCDKCQGRPVSGGFKPCANSICSCHGKFVEVSLKEPYHMRDHSHCFTKDGQEGHEKHLQCCLCKKPQDPHQGEKIGVLHPCLEHSQPQPTPEEEGSYPLPAYSIILDEFMECDTCRPKPGTPPLCEGCLHNRRAISRFKNMIAQARLQAEREGERKGLEIAAQALCAYDIAVPPEITDRLKSK